MTFHEVKMKITLSNTINLVISDEKPTYDSVYVYRQIFIRDHECQNHEINMSRSLLRLAGWKKRNGEKGE